MAMIYQFDGKKVKELKDDKEIHAYNSLKDFIEDDILDDLFLDISHGHNYPPKINDEAVKKIILNYLLKEFSDFFKENNNSIEDHLLDKYVRTLNIKFKNIGKMLDKKIQEFVTSFVVESLESTGNLKNKKIGGDMFKTIKEARNFTAHLDSLASEIESLEGIAPEMKQHLAYRIDRLSDLIEISAVKEEKTAAIEKEAMGIGTGTWAYDEDESRYMSTFGGTGALKRDPDEPYMDKFTADQDGGDHKEVLTRHEPAEIRGDGQKAPQPSDNYNEAEVASNLKSTIKSLISARKK